MFDDTNLDDLYGDPVVAHDAVIAALAAKALGRICKESAKCCERERLARCAARKAERIVQRCRTSRS
ncbi:MAG: hypothetical protein GVY34_05100 [Alphaproteobacteria bacterium]|jgi:hypothetical protein|nr:hypothetical protein [Alphaproteobacteria bacterium]